MPFFVRSNSASIVMASTVAGYVALFFTLSWAKHRTFHATSYDLANYVRSVWGLIHGDPYVPLLGGSYVWGAHFDPILYVPALLGRWVPIIPLLLFLQSLALGFTGWVAFLGAKRALGPAAALFLGGAVLLHPSIHNANLFEFHPLTLGLPFLALFLYFWSQRRFDAATLALLIALMAREETAGILFVWGLYRMRHDRWKGRALFLLSILWVVTLVLVKFGNQEVWTDHFTRALTQVASNRLEILGTKLRDPFLVLLGFGLLPLYRPKALIWILLPVLFFLAYPTGWYGRIDFHYTAFYIPFLAFASIQALEAIDPRKRKLAMMVFGICAVVISWSYSLAPWNRNGDPGSFMEDRYARAADAILSKISPEMSVAAPVAMLASLAERKWIFKEVAVGVDALILEKNPVRTLGESESNYKERLRSIPRIIRDVAERFHYRPEYEGKDLVLFLRTRRQ